MPNRVFVNPSSKLSEPFSKRDRQERVLSQERKLQNDEAMTLYWLSLRCGSAVWRVLTLFWQTCWNPRPLILRVENDEPVNGLIWTGYNWSWKENARDDHTIEKIDALRGCGLWCGLLHSMLHRFSRPTTPRLFVRDSSWDAKVVNWFILIDLE